MDHIIGQLATIGERYSDCTIQISDGERFNAHRILLHLHSAVLAETLSERGPGAALDLQHDDPAALRAMLSFFYRGTYKTPAASSAMAFHVAVFQIAEKYQTSALETLAFDSFRDLLLAASWSAQDLVEAATKLEKIAAPTPRSAQMKYEIIQAVSKGSYDLFDSDAFKSFIQAHPEWIIRLLKIYDPESQSHEEGVALDSRGDGAAHANDHKQLGGDDASGGLLFTPDYWGTTDYNISSGWETSAFTGGGRTIGRSMGNDTTSVYGQGGRKPPSREFQKKFPPT